MYISEQRSEQQSFVVANPVSDCISHDHSDLSNCSSKRSTDAVTDKPSDSVTDVEPSKWIY